MNCYHLISLKLCAENEGILTEEIFDMAWNLKIGFSVLLHCIQLITVLSETSQIMYYIPGLWSE